MKKSILLLFVFLLSVTSVYADYYIVTANSLNVRSKPNSQAQVVTKVKQNQKVQVISFSDNKQWAKVAVGSRQGWVSAKYIEPAPAAVTTPQEPADEPLGMMILRWLTYIGAALGAISFLAFLVPAAKRHKLLPHLFVLGGSTFALVVLATSPDVDTARILIGPFLLMNVFTWPFLYIRNKGVTTVVFLVFLLVLLFVVMGAMKVGINSGFFRFALTVLLLLFSVGIFATVIGAGKQIDYICPKCGMYADHNSMGSEYVGSTFSAKDDVRDVYDRTEVSGNTITDYYIREHNIKHYEHKEYNDWYHCCRCGHEFHVKRTVTQRV